MNIVCHDYNRYNCNFIFQLSFSQYIDHTYASLFNSPTFSAHHGVAYRNLSSEWFSVWMILLLNNYFNINSCFAFTSFRQLKSEDLIAPLSLGAVIQLIISMPTKLSTMKTRNCQPLSKCVIIF